MVVGGKATLVVFYIENNKTLPFEEVLAKIKHLNIVLLFNNLSVNFLLQ